MASLQLPNCKKKSVAHKNGFEVLVPLPFILRVLSHRPPVHRVISWCHADIRRFDLLQVSCIFFLPLLLLDLLDLPTQPVRHLVMLSVLSEIIVDHLLFTTICLFMKRWWRCCSWACRPVINNFICRRQQYVNKWYMTPGWAAARGRGAYFLIPLNWCKRGKNPHSTSRRCY